MTRESTWLATLAEQAAHRLEPALVEYILAGARDARTTADAVASWERVEFSPRVLYDVSTIDMSTRPLGGRSPVPWGIAPTTLQRTVHPDGEVAMARAVAETGGVLVVSSNAGTAFSTIAATGCRWWLQIYLPHDRDLARPLIDRAVEAGAEAVVLTLDTPVVGTKYPRSSGESIWTTIDPATVRTNFDRGYEDHPGSRKALDLGPGDLGWLAKVSGLPVVAKGVLRPDDAQRCRAAGAAAIWVSNHGGRQLDRSCATVDALGPVAAALDGETEVFVDGGVTNGLDVVAGLALGADLVFLGRLPLLSLMDGEQGVRRLARELDLQIEETMRLLGCSEVEALRGCAELTPCRRP